MSAALDQIRPRLADELPPIPVKRWTREQYHQLAEMGCFDDEQVELLEGWIIPKSAHSPLHDGMVSIVEEALRGLAPEKTILRVKSSLAFDLSETEPDLAMVCGKGDWYHSGHPRGDECLVVVEVAESSLATDRWKADVYAAAGVPTYWIVDLLGDTVEVYDRPDRNTGKYSTRRIFYRNSRIKFHLGDSRRTIPADHLLPPMQSDVLKIWTRGLPLNDR